ncbi:MAG: bifunctional adenosylcobinamide kinase/adenosylcobinamide-phosphate guanylyltransferase [Mariprofundaceae bacterium]|nr:bifunctional adenosylcobinamide kinase/adenosylcobinamide-phosphate guanylyltransferase [Mariprofundaceae bacterium]
MAVSLILGGARSGKSKWAEKTALLTGLTVNYVATAPYIEGDVDWQKRIALHQSQRPKIWETIEEPLAIQALCAADTERQCILVDCLSLWLSNLIFAEMDVLAEIDTFLAALKMSKHEVILVSNELGLGLVPETKLGRDFRDAQGLLNQKVAQVADVVTLLVAGLPMNLK